MEGEIRAVLQGRLFRFECLEPMARWRIEIDDAAKGVQVELDFVARCPAYLHRHVRLPGAHAPVIDQRHYNQSGRLHGALRVGGETSRELIGMKNRS